MNRVHPQRRQGLFTYTTLLVLALLLVTGGPQIAAQQTEGKPPKAGLQDVPDLVIFNTGEVKGALVPGG